MVEADATGGRCGAKPAAPCSDGCGITQPYLCRGDAWVCTIEGTGTCQEGRCDAPTEDDRCFDECGLEYDASCHEASWECVLPERACTLVTPPDHAPVWFDDFGGDFEQDATHVAVGPDGSSYVATSFLGAIFWDGGVYRESAAGYDLVVTKYDPDGERAWITHFATPRDGRSFGLALHPDGTLLLMRSVEPTFFPNPLELGHASMVRLDTADGSILEERAMGVRLAPTKGTYLGVDPVSGDIVVAGQTANPVSVAGGPTVDTVGEGMDIFVARLSADFSPIWTRVFGGDGPEQVNSVDVDASGRVFVAGTFDSTDLDIDGTSLSAGGGDGFLMALDGATGQAVWTKALDGPGEGSLHDVRATGDGGVVVAGAFAGPGSLSGYTLVSTTSAAQPVVARLDSAGDVVFARSIVAELDVDDVPFWKTAGLSNGEIFVAGGAKGDRAGDVDVALLRVDGFSGDVLWTDRFGDGYVNVVRDLEVLGSAVTVVGSFSDRIDLGMGSLERVRGGAFVATFDRLAP